MIAPFSFYILVRFQIEKIIHQNSKGQTVCDVCLIEKKIYYSLIFSIISIIGISGTIGINNHQNNIIHYIFATILFLSFSIDSFLQQAIKNEEYKQNKITIIIMQIVMYWIILFFGIVSMIGHIIQIYSIISIGEIGFFTSIIFTWIFDYQYITKINIKIEINGIHGKIIDL